jgi:hypothetical protein
MHWKMKSFFFLLFSLPFNLFIITYVIRSQNIQMIYDILSFITYNVNKNAVVNKNAKVMSTYDKEILK